MDLAAARADRKGIVGANMNLTEAQAKAFLAAVRRLRGADG
jgi:hypothetical protein